MICRLPLCLLITLLIGISSSSGVELAPDTEGYNKEILPFMEQFCIQCHDEDVQKGDVRFDTISEDLVRGKDTELWKDILHRLETGEMPPEDKKQPTDAQREVVTQWISRELKKHLTAKVGVPGRVVVRRLSRDEYRNTMKDLLGLPFDIGSDLPPDTNYKGFRNVAEVQELSPEQIESYFSAARFAIENAVVHGDKPLSVRYAIEPEKVSEAGEFFVETGGNEQKQQLFRSLKPDDRALREMKDFDKWKPDPKVHNINYKENTVQNVEMAKDGVWLKASNMLNTGERNPWGRLHCGLEAIPWIEGATYRLRIKAGASKGPEMGDPIMTILSRGKLLTRLPILADAKNPQWYTFEYTLNDLKPIALHNRDNRAWRAKNRDVIIHNGYEFPGMGGGKRTVKRYELPDGRELPSIFIDRVEFSYNHFPEWPPASHHRILFDSPNIDEPRVYAEEVLTRFMSRAFRRPVRPEELDTKLALFDRKWAETKDFILAIREPLVATLMSPQFLFIGEDAKLSPDERRSLEAFELASRLSYFIWQTMPDTQLLQKAQSGELLKSAFLQAETNRLLDDPRGKRLSMAFVDQWLQLEKLDGIMVEDDRWTYSDTFKEVMKAEPGEFFAHLLSKDLSLFNLIDSDFVMVNERLALHYDIPDVFGSHFRPVPLKPDQPRGGLMTQAACMTLTTDGMITSPIYRGVWVLDKIIDRKPPEAPANVPPLEDAPTERLPLREQFARHREDAGCASCHKRIDPIGWPFERYGLLGDYRETGWGPNWERYHNSRINKDGKIPDMHGVLPDGTKVDTVDDLKRVFMENHRPDLLRSVTKNMFIYALGRPLDLSDEEEIEGVIKQVEAKQGSARALIHAIVNSAPFREK